MALIQKGLKIKAQQAALNKELAEHFGEEVQGG